MCSSDLAEEAKAKAIVKSKCMTSEEIHLNDALEKAGYGVVESDLGEFIQQLRGEAPYHFVFPCMHVKREAISELFTKHLGTAPTDSPEELTMIARHHLRQLYVDADIGITGANFLVAETGSTMIVTNEGKMIRIAMKNVRVISRNTQGVTLVKLEQDSGEYVVSVAPVVEKDSGGDEE